MRLTFAKYQGTGNDFIMIDDRDHSIEPKLDQELISRLCTRRIGIGADGLILLQSASKVDFHMKYFNKDGNEGSMCGNGARCIIAFAHDLGWTQTHFQFEATDGVHLATYHEEHITIQMINPYGYQEISPQEVWLYTGSPHFVSFQDKPVSELDVFELGRNIRYSEPFAEEGTNVNFVNAIDENTLMVRTYERGVEDETLSCGTGVTAAVYAYLLRNGWANNEMHVQTLGGKLSVQVEHPGTDAERVSLSGPALKVFEGSVNI